MPQKTIPRKTSISALAFDLLPGAGGVVTEAHLLPPGPFRAVDGRPQECAAWQLDAAIAARVIALAASRKTDILIDFEHQSLRARQNGQRAEAAGWIPRSMEWRDPSTQGGGLYATGIAWVGDTAALIAQKKYRYISSVFLYDADSGEVLEIISVALTNTPALDGLEALADLARTFSVSSTQMEADMADEKQLAALTVERDGLKTQLAELTSARDGLKAQLATLTAERDGLKAKVDAGEQAAREAALAADKAKHADLLQAALADGRLTPAQKPWADKQPLAALTEYLDASKPLPIAGDPQADGKGAAGAHGLNQDELAMCTRMGVTPEEFTKAKQSQA